MIRTLPDGTVIIPDIAMVGLFQWAAELGWEQARDLLHAYDEQAGLAFAVQHAHLPIEEYRAVAQQAALRGMTVEPGVQTVN